MGAPLLSPLLFSLSFSKESIEIQLRIRERKGDINPVQNIFTTNSFTWEEKVVFCYPWIFLSKVLFSLFSLRLSFFLFLFFLNEGIKKLHTSLKCRSLWFKRWGRWETIHNSEKEGEKERGRKRERQKKWWMRSFSIFFPPHLTGWWTRIGLLCKVNQWLTLSLSFLPSSSLFFLFLLCLHVYFLNTIYRVGKVRQQIKKCTKESLIQRERGERGRG